MRDQGFQLWSKFIWMNKFEQIITQQGRKVIYDPVQEAPYNGHHQAVWINSNTRQFNLVVYQDIGDAVQQLIWNWYLIRDRWKTLGLSMPNIRHLDDLLSSALLVSTTKSCSRANWVEQRTKSSVHRFFLERDYFDAYVYDVDNNPDKYTKTVEMTNSLLRDLYNKYKASERSCTQSN